jgi:hypothetical protein
MANAWGELSWSTGSWGQQNNVSVLLTGQQVNCAQNNVGTSTEVNSGWGRLTWGENAWGIAGDVLVTGIGVSAGIGTGSVSIDVQPQLSGQQLNINLGQVQGFGLAEVFPTGIQLNTNLGTVDPAPDVMLTGIELTTTTGTLEGYNNTGWGRLYWGDEVWGASGVWAFGEPTGIQLNASLGSVVANAVTIASPIGNELTIAEGIVDPSPDAMVTGIGMTVGVGLGSIVSGTAEVDLTGNQLNIAQGTAVLDAITIAQLSGQGLNISLNSVVPGASAEVDPTGNALTIASGSINVQSWQIVDTGSNVNWNIIDTAA